MKIPPAQSDNFIRSLQNASDIRAALLYGPDSGLISERNRTISNSITDINDPFNLVEVPYDTVKSDPAWLADEIAALSFSGKRKLIRVITTAPGFEDALKTALTNTPGDNFVLFLAGNLPPSSALRKFFEKTERMAALPCYADDAVGIRKHINQTFNGKFTLDSEALEYLQHACTGNRQLITSELNKLAIYMGSQSHIRYEDVVDCIGQTKDASLNELCLSVMSCDSQAVEAKFNLVVQGGVAPIAIIRVLMYYIIRLHNVKSQTASGASDQAALATLRPPVFFKDMPIFKKHLALWSVEALEVLLHSLEKCERECKKAAMPVEVFCHQLLTILPFYRNVRKRAS